MLRYLVNAHTSPWYLRAQSCIFIEICVSDILYRRIIWTSEYIGRKEEISEKAMWSLLSSSVRTTYDNIAWETELWLIFFFVIYVRLFQETILKKRWFSRAYLIQMFLFLRIFFAIKSIYFISLLSLSLRERVNVLYFCVLTGEKTRKKYSRKGAVKFFYGKSAGVQMSLVLAADIMDDTVSGRGSTR